MEILISIIKYTFVAAFAVEIGLILRALVLLAREKASAAVVVATPEE